MKKAIVVLVLFLCKICAYSQTDVTQFLGIPVDGSKSEMIQKIEAKGFTYNRFQDCLEGVFNGSNVNVYVLTNKEKVCRIAVVDANHVGESDIRIRFNNLCRQFENNKKYMSVGDHQIPDDENIRFESRINHKRYEAVFFQNPNEEVVANLMNQHIHPYLSSKYSLEELANPTEKIKEEIMELTSECLKEIYGKKLVWFMINESYGDFYITIFYDNEYNRANGEDL